MSPSFTFNMSNDFSRTETININSFPFSSLFFIQMVIGRRRLEIRSTGIRSFIFMDFCDRLCGWHMFNYTPSAITLRHNESNRYSILKDRKKEARTTKNGEYGCLANTRVRSRCLDVVPSMVTDPGQSRQPLNPK